MAIAQIELFDAIRAGSVARVKEMLAADKALANARNESGLSAVLSAVYHGKTEIAKLLIEAGAQLDIFEAAATGAQERLEELLGQDPALLNAYSPDGWTPLHLAVYFGRINIVHVLLSKGAAINAIAKNTEAVTPLHSALANRNNAAIAQLLIACGADVGAQQAAGMTPLHYAASQGLESVVCLLLDRGVDTQARDASGKTASDIALEQGHRRVADLIDQRTR